MQVNKNIKLIRELSGKKQGEFAKIVKTNLSNLKTYENTQVKPKANVLAAIADYAGVSVDDLLTKKLTHKDVTFDRDEVEIVENDSQAGPVSTVNEKLHQYISKGTDKDKYVDLLERDRSFFESSLKDNLNLITANLTELLRSQRYDRAQLTTLLAVTSRTLAKVEKRDVETVFEETNKAVNDLIREQM